MGFENVTTDEVREKYCGFGLHWPLKPVHWSPILGGVFDCVTCEATVYRPLMRKAQFQRLGFEPKRKAA